MATLLKLLASFRAVVHGRPTSLVDICGAREYLA